LFQWNAGSWDFQGVRRDSRGFRNTELVNLVKNHNDYVNYRR
jgi:hypothetical protein